MKWGKGGWGGVNLAGYIQYSWLQMLTVTRHKTKKVTIIQKGGNIDGECILFVMMLLYCALGSQ